MQSFSMGTGYLRQEALKSGFILESDNDDKLVERLSQVVRKLGPEDAEKCDALTKAGNVELETSDEPSSDQGPEGEA